MNKLAHYLNQHLLGEVATDLEVRKRFATDNSPLVIVPDMVVYPRLTNDIRKLLKFSWQLAEKGHVLSVTPRGSGTDVTGGSIGSGVVLNTAAHMNTIFELDAKQRLVRVQPGVQVDTLSQSLRLQGLQVPALATVGGDATVGGAMMAGKTSPTVTEWVDQIEVVLASGDVLQTKRISKKELGKKKGLQGFEGDIYRGIDALIEDNRELVGSLQNAGTSVGYSGIADVKRKDGSFDLLPLFAGSQGTLGVISEMILRADFAAPTESMAVVAFADAAQARDALDVLSGLGLSNLEYLDKSVLRQATSAGKQLPFQTVTDPAAVFVVSLNDPAARAQGKKLKKMAKSLEQFGAEILATDDIAQSDLVSIKGIIQIGLQTDDELAPLPIADGMYIPHEFTDTFLQGVRELEVKYKTSLLVYGQPLEGIWTVRPVVALGKVSGKQMVLKFVDDISQLAARSGGSLAYQNGEGRMQAFSTHRQIDERLAKLYVDIRAVFDPYGVLNSGVKQSGEVKDLAKNLRSSYIPQGKDALPRL